MVIKPLSIITCLKFVEVYQEYPVDCYLSLLRTEYYLSLLRTGSIED
jgi:hypothetical protein